MTNWLTRLFRKVFKKRNYKDEIFLSDKQFAILQRLSGYFLLRKEELAKNFPEIAGELECLYKTTGDSWEWFPRLSSKSKIEAEVRRFPTYYEIEGGLPEGKDCKWEFRLFELGIRAKGDGKIIRRAKLMANKIIEKTEEDFLEQLSKI